MDKESARERALTLILRILRDGAYFQEAVSEGLSDGVFDARDRAFILLLTRGVIEKKTALDAVLTRVSQVKPEEMDLRIRCILYLGMYQILYTDTAPYAAVNESISLLHGRKEQGLTGYVNAVLRRCAREKDALLGTLTRSVRAGIPDTIFKVWKEGYGTEKALAVSEAFARPVPNGQCIRLNLSKGTAPMLLAALEADGIYAVPSGFSKDTYFTREANLAETESFQEGLFYIQDLGSALITESLRTVLEGAPEDVFVLDACASPGGKTIHTADMLAGKGRILACDLTQEKLIRLDENIIRSGFRNIRTEQKDATVQDPALIAEMDLVIADLPCSGLGTLREKPDIRLRFSRDKRASLVKLQQEMLDNLSAYVKPGGVLLYSTCTLDPEENEHQFHEFLSRHPEFRPEKIVLQESKLKKAEMERGYLTLFPDEIPGGGFFVSLMRKSGKEA